MVLYPYFAPRVRPTVNTEVRYLEDSGLEFEQRITVFTLLLVLTAHLKLSTSGRDRNAFPSTGWNGSPCVIADNLPSYISQRVLTTTIHRREIQSYYKESWHMFEDLK